MKFFFLVFLSFWTVCAYPKLKQRQKIRFRERLALFEQEKWLRFWAIKRFRFEKICHRFEGNTSPTLRKSDTDFREICHRLWGNPSPILRKPVTDFGEIRYRFWGNLSPILGKLATDFGEIRLWENQPPTLRKICHRL